MKIFLADGTEGDVGRFAECPGVYLSLFGNDQRYPCIDLVCPVGKHRQHIVGFGFVCRLSQNLIPVYDDRVRTDHDAVLLPVAAEDIFCFLRRQFHHDL